MFMSKLQMHYLDLAERLYIDGTFKMAPTGFLQLLTVKNYITKNYKVTNNYITKIDIKLNYY